MQLRNGRPGVRTVARRMLDIALGAGLLVVVTSVSPEAAYAHDTVTSSVPADGSIVAQAPDTVTVRFEGAVSRATVDVTDGCGDRVPVRVTVAGSRLTAALRRDPATPGTGAARPARWTAAWRVAGSDGHLVRGTISFTVRDDRCADESTADDETGHQNAGHEDAKAEAGASGVDAKADAAHATETRNLPMLPVGAAIIVVLALLALALTRRHPGVGHS
jgi:methionine-rich copper-binding protein CopC